MASHPKATVCLICFSEPTTIPTWEHAGAVWPSMGKMASTVPSTTSRIPHSVLKFDRDMQEMKGNLGVGCISDYEPQPLLVRSHHGTFAITTVGRINNAKDLTKQIFDRGNAHFLEMSGGDINPTELVAALINQKLNLIDGIRYAQEQIDGSLSFLILTPKGIYAAVTAWDGRLWSSERKRRPSVSPSKILPI